MTSDSFDPLNQTFFLEGPGNMSIPVWLPDVDSITQVVVSGAICYGSQIGACFIMLLVTLTMTSKTRFWRAATIINVSGLVIGTIRCTLLALYFTSSYIEFYTLYSGSDTFSANDTRISAAATFFALPQLIMLEAALFLQAYSMIQLWPSVWKSLTIALSVLVAVFAIGFKGASVGVRLHNEFSDTGSFLWLFKTDLAFTATTIFWFCFVFIIRLVIHMWEYHSILPPMGGVSAMEVLVMTNGILMLVPVVFAAMELGQFTKFEAGSLTYTSVVVLLPLGTLIAQHLASTNGNSSKRSTGASGGTGGPRSGVSGTGTGTGGRRGAYGRAASDATNSKRNLFATTWSHTSEASAAVVSGGIATQVHIHGSSGGAGGADYCRSTRSDSLAKSKALDAFDQELKLIDATPTTTNFSAPSSGRVRVDREVEVRKDMV